jgi:hypothetical protein
MKMSKFTNQQIAFVIKQAESGKLSQAHQSRKCRTLEN